ncbi:MAG: TOBE domain-containing protein [Thermoplasmata archaeon]|nr:TOBE domain-containing protein [Thermoplasmata archaeon]
MHHGSREVVLTPLDRDLLVLLERATTLVDACRRLGISRDRGAYRLRRLARALRTPVAIAHKGGAAHGTTRLTRAGLAVLREDPGAAVGPARGHLRSGREPLLHGTYRPGPPPFVELAGGTRLAVAFEATAGESVSVHLDPESILVATQRFATSARNVLGGTIRAIDRSASASGAGRVLLRVKVGAMELAVALTESAVGALRLRPGRRVFLYVKATALHRRAPLVATRGSLPR